MTTRTSLSTALSPALSSGIISPRRARSEFEQPKQAPFLVERTELMRPAATAVDAESDGAVRLVLRGVARRPAFAAGVAALVAVTGIGLFLGLMLGDLAG